MYPAKGKELFYHKGCKFAYVGVDQTSRRSLRGASTPRFPLFGYASTTETSTRPSGSLRMTKSAYGFWFKRSFAMPTSKTASCFWQEEPHPPLREKAKQADTAFSVSMWFPFPRGEGQHTCGVRAKAFNRSPISVMRENKQILFRPAGAYDNSQLPKGVSCLPLRGRGTAFGGG